MSAGPHSSLILWYNKLSRVRALPHGEVMQMQKPRLTTTQMRVLTILAAGGSRRTVADALHISVSAVRGKITRLKDEFGLPRGADTADLVAAARERGILPGASRKRDYP